MLHYLQFVGLGISFGFIAGLFGSSGGVVAVPVLVVFFGFHQQRAEGTALVMIVPNLAIGFWRYWRAGDIDKRMAIVLICAAIPFSIVAALFAVHLPHEVLRHAFAGFTFALAAFMAYRLIRPDDARDRKAPRPFAAIPGAIGGTIAGLFAGGGSLFCVAMLNYFFSLSQVAAQGMAIAVDFPATLMSLITFGVARDVDWLTGLALAVGGATTVHAGAAAAHRIPERVLRALFFCYVVAAGSALLIKHG